MAQIFHPSTNTIAKATIFGALFVIAAAAWVGAQVYRSSYVTRVDEAIEQPVQFSHEHHVGGLGIDCRYCHTTVETSYFAGMPNTKTCMTCHSQIWTNAEILAPVRASWQTGTPIRWNRVHDLPDFSHFDHGIHVQKGIGCVSCHGRVDQMPLMWKEQSLQMEWCLSCHRDPGKHVRPREEVFNLDWQWPENVNREEEVKKLIRAYNIKTEPVPAKDDHHEFKPNQITNCSVCHY
jgi:hypothetical protein